MYICIYVIAPHLFSRRQILKDHQHMNVVSLIYIIYIYIHVYVYIHTCIYIYIYVHLNALRIPPGQFKLQISSADASHKVTFFSVTSFASIPEVWRVAPTNIIP